MSLFSNLFKRGPDALQLSDWLENIKEVFMKLGSETLSGDKSSEDMLVYFTLINATHSANNILHNVPSIASRIGTVYGELRAYFECTWQIALLLEYEAPEDRIKISKLYRSVAMRLEQTMNSLFSQNPGIKLCLQSAIGKPYERQLYAAVREYIHVQRKNPKHETGDLLADNIQALSSAIQSASGFNEKDRDSVVRVLNKDTANVLQMKFLTQFDFRNCKYLDLPDSFYRPFGGG